MATSEPILSCSCFSDPLNDTFFNELQIYIEKESFIISIIFLGMSLFFNSKIVYLPVFIILYCFFSVETCFLSETVEVVLCPTVFTALEVGKLG